MKQVHSSRLLKIQQLESLIMLRKHGIIVFIGVVFLQMVEVNQQENSRKHFKAHLEVLKTLRIYLVLQQQQTLVLDGLGWFKTRMEA